MLCTRLLPAVALTIVAAATTGCGNLKNPYDTAHVATTTTAVAPNAAATATSTAKPSASAAAPTPATAEQAVRRFATMFINWRFEQLPAIKTALVDQASGPLADELRKAAAQATTEVSRRLSNQANEGTVKVVDDPAHNAHFYVVTRETAKLGDAHGQSGYFVYTATVTRVGNTYKLTSFVAAN